MVVKLPPKKQGAFYIREHPAACDLLPDSRCQGLVFSERKFTLIMAVVAQYVFDLDTAALRSMQPACFAPEIVARLKMSVSETPCAADLARGSRLLICAPCRGDSRAP